MVDWFLEGAFKEAGARWIVSRGRRRAFLRVSVGLVEGVGIFGVCRVICGNRAQEACRKVKESYIHSGRKLSLYAGSITDLKVDAVVTAANSRLAGGGGVDGAVHRAAGPRLLEACRAVRADAAGQRCPTGQARITPGFDLAPWVIHAVGPIYDPARAELCRQQLASAYDMALFLAGNRECGSVALPSISTGVYGYPLAEAAQVAVDRVARFLERETSVAQVIFALRGQPAHDAFSRAARSRLG